MKATNFDVNEYNVLLDKFSKSRKNVEHLDVYKALQSVKPNGEIPSNVQDELKKYCDTNPSSSWGACKLPAQKIWNFLFKA